MFVVKVRYIKDHPYNGELLVYNKVDGIFFNHSDAANAVVFESDWEPSGVNVNLEHIKRFTAKEVDVDEFVHSVSLQTDFRNYLIENVTRIYFESNLRLSTAPYLLSFKNRAGEHLTKYHFTILESNTFETEMMKAIPKPQSTCGYSRSSI